MSSKKWTQANKDDRIAEYSELRAEIRHYLDRRETITQFSLLVTAASTGLAASLPDLSGYPFGVAVLLIAALWYDSIRSIRAVYRVAAYLRVVVEPNLPGTLWETLGRHHRVHRQHLSRWIAGLVFPLTYIVNLALMGVRVNLALRQSRLELGGLLLIGILLVLANIWVHWKVHDREEKEWRRLVAEHLPTDEVEQKKRSKEEIGARP